MEERQRRKVAKFWGCGMGDWEGCLGGGRIRDGRPQAAGMQPASRAAVQGSVFTLSQKAKKKTTVITAAMTAG
jgi:hypothetical protein